MELSVVSTLYRSRIFLETFLEEILKSVEAIQVKEFELIFVNDGSPDDSLDYLISRKADITQISILDLSRNFGHHYAIQAGLTHASGKHIFLIDNDLEAPPSLLIDFYTKLKENPSADVVFGYQEDRKGGFIEKNFGKTFWYLINILSDTRIPHNILTERLMTRQFVTELLRLGDANLFLGGMLHWTGFRQIGVPVKKGTRQGASTYSAFKRTELMLQAITSFSSKPLEWLFYSGVVISFISIFFIIFLVIKKLIYQDLVSIGWTSLIAVNILILGIISTFLGIIGIYISKIFRQVQSRPNFIIRKIY